MINSPRFRFEMSFGFFVPHSHTDHISSSIIKGDIFGQNILDHCSQSSFWKKVLVRKKQVRSQAQSIPGSESSQSKNRGQRPVLDPNLWPWPRSWIRHPEINRGEFSNTWMLEQLEFFVPVPILLGQWDFFIPPNFASGYDFSSKAKVPPISLSLYRL